MSRNAVLVKELEDLPQKEAEFEDIPELDQRFNNPDDEDENIFEPPLFFNVQSKKPH